MNSYAYSRRVQRSQAEKDAISWRVMGWNWYFVVIQLKGTAFKPEYAGQLNFYLSAVDGSLKGEHDQPTIGLLLCRSKNNVVAEYALKDYGKPIGIAEYTLVRAIPDDFATKLPTIDQIEAELRQDIAGEIEDE